MLSELSELHWFLYLPAMQHLQWWLMPVYLRDRTLHHRVCADVSGHLFHLTIKSEKKKKVFSGNFVCGIFVWVLRVCSFSDVYDKPIKRLWHSSVRLIFSLISNNTAATQVDVDRCIRVPVLCFNSRFDCLTVAGRALQCRSIRLSD